MQVLSAMTLFVIRLLRCHVPVKSALKTCSPPFIVIIFCLLLLTNSRWNAEIGVQTSVAVSDPPTHLSHRMVRLPVVCANESCRFDYVNHLQVSGSHPIPAIRHILWRSEQVSHHFAQQLLTWKRIHPDWTFVLWRDQDMEPFVATYFPGLLAKFKSLPEHMMRVDMIRYMLLYQFGGTYADLDYKLVRSLDSFRRFHAVVTREPEAHSLHFLGMTWPARIMASPAFMMSAPGHAFYFFAMEKLRRRKATGDREGETEKLFQFAGPIGLVSILEEYAALRPIATNPMDTVYVPPSRNFYPYPDNRINNKIEKSSHVYRTSSLGAACKNFMSQHPSKRSWRLVQYCADVTNLDPITDGSQPVFAIHDLNKPGAAYVRSGKKVYFENMIDARRVIPNLISGQAFMSSR